LLLNAAQQAADQGPPLIDLLDILAVILGVLYTVRKLDVSRREAKDFPAVPPERFEAWQRREARVYTVASWACLLKILLDPGTSYLGLLKLLGQAPPAEHLPLVWVAGPVVDLSWVLVMVWTAVRAARSRRERAEIGVQLAPEAPR
jgi:hypothetical protein